MRFADAGRRRGILLCAALAAALCPAAVADEAPFILFDADGKPIPYARVSVVGRTGSASTDAEGRFRLSPRPVPPFEIAVFDEAGRWLGKQRVVQLAAEGPSRIFLPPQEQVEVNVHGGVAPDTFAPPAAGATVVSRSDVESRQATQLFEVLNEVPSTTRLGGGAAAVPSLRGLARGRTLLLIDNGQVTTERRAGPSATYLDPFTVENVEVVRGPGSVFYGAGSMGGVIHMRTPSPSSDRVSGRFQLGAGTGLEYRAGAGEVNLPIGKGGMLVQVHGRDFDDYESPEGVVPNSFSRDHGWLIKGLVPGGDSRWTIGLQSDRAGETGKPGRGVPDARVVYPDEESDRLTLAGDMSGLGAFDSMSLNLFVGRYRLVTDQEQLPTATGNREIFRSDLDANDALVRWVTSRSMDRGTLRVGLDVESRFDLEATNSDIEFDDGDQQVSRVDSPAIEDARRINTGVFAEWEHVLAAQRSSFAVGGRVQHSSTANEGGPAGDRSSSDGTFTGYFAYTFHPVDEWTVAVQAARAFREPTLSALYFTGVTGRGFIEANPDLQPETSRQLDLSVQHSGPLAHFGAYAYYYRIDDLIERYRRPDGIFAWRNRGEEELYGLEVESDVNFGKKFSARVRLSGSRGTILDDGSPAADVPPLTGALSFRHRPWERLWWRLGLTLVAWDNRPGPTEMATPAYGLLDLSTGITLVRGLEARLILSNVLDRDYPSSADDDAVLAPGRSGALVLAGDF